MLSYDRLITGCELDLYLTFDNVKVGELQARFLADRIPQGGKLRLIRIYGAKTDNNAKLFKQGQDNVLEPLIAAGKVEVIFEDWAEDWKPESAKRIAQGTQAMTVYKPIQSIATQAAELAMKLAQRRPIVAKDAVANGKGDVPSVLLNIVSVTKENLRDTVVKDGFRKESDVFQSTQP